jgi:hypothetical protein
MALEPKGNACPLSLKRKCISLTVPDDDFYLLSLAIDEGMRGAESRRA